MSSVLMSQPERQKSLSFPCPRLSRAHPGLSAWAVSATRSSLPPAQACALSGGAAETPVALALASCRGEGAALKGAALSPSPAPLHLRGHRRLLRAALAVHSEELRSPCRKYSALDAERFLPQTGRWLSGFLFPSE